MPKPAGVTWGSHGPHCTSKVCCECNACHGPKP